jgi:hypothetical protein
MQIACIYSQSVNDEKKIILKSEIWRIDNFPVYLSINIILEINDFTLTASRSPSDVGGTKWRGVKASSFSWRTYIITRSQGGGVNFRRFDAGDE